jgi:hypothetical protein
MVNRTMKKKRKTGAVTVDTVLWSGIRQLILEARRSVVRGVNAALVWTNFEIGRRIVEYEQKGKARAEYAEETLKQLSKRLVAEFSQGYSERNLRLMRQFYRMYGKPQSEQHVSGEKIWQTVSAKSAIGQKTQTLSGQSELPKLQTPSAESDQAMSEQMLYQLQKKSRGFSVVSMVSVL